MSKTEMQRFADLIFGETFAEMRAKMELREKRRTVKDTTDQKQEKADEESRDREDHA